MIEGVFTWSIAFALVSIAGLLLAKYDAKIRDDESFYVIVATLSLLVSLGLLMIGIRSL